MTFWRWLTGWFYLCDDFSALPRVRWVDGRYVPYGEPVVPPVRHAETPSPSEIASSVARIYVSPDN
jgi:hypothetical protein